MLTNLVKLEHVIGDRAYHFLCDNNSPLNEVKDAVLEFLKYVQRAEDQAKANALQAQAEADAKAKKLADEEKSKQESVEKFEEPIAL